ncbi:unnamed protein product [Camellia sinensis]
MALPKAPKQWMTGSKSSVSKRSSSQSLTSTSTPSGKNPTVVKVAQANMTFKSPTFLGQINMFDDPLTVGPEPNSTKVGRAQGFYGFAGMEEFGLVMTMNFYFTTGDVPGIVDLRWVRFPAGTWNCHECLES